MSDSSPNFDFLTSGPDSGVGSGVGGWSPPDSSVNVAEPPAGEKPAAVPKSPTPNPVEPKPARAKEVPRKASSAKPDRTKSSGRRAGKPEPAAPEAATPADSAPAAAPAHKGSSRRKSGRKPSKPAAGGGSLDDFRVEGPKAVVLVSYAATMTLIAIWALWSMRAGSAHQLESLPDVPPREEGAFIQYPEDAALPPGHVVKLGEARRFGDVRVEPLGVERSAASLKHYSGDTSLRPPGGGETVLKLRLRLTNESGGRAFAPLDRRVVYERRVTDDFRTLSNQFVVAKSKKGSADPNVLLYDLSPDGEWDLEGQPLEPLEPGESVETVLAAGPEGLDALEGVCLWRVMLRKGIGPSGHGVLTMIEVPFRIADVRG